MLNLQNDQILSISSSISLQFYIKKSFIWFDAVFINSYYNNTLQIDLICDKTLFSLQCDRIFNHKKNRVADFVTINIGSPHKHTHSLYNKNNLILSLPNKKQKRTCTIRKYSSILVSVELLVMPYVLTVVLRTIIYIHMCVCVHTYIHIVCISHEEAYNWLYEINCISACVYKWMCVWMMKVNVWSGGCLYSPMNLWVSVVCWTCRRSQYSHSRTPHHRATAGTWSNHRSPCRSMSPPKGRPITRSPVHLAGKWKLTKGLNQTKYLKSSVCG